MKKKEIQAMQKAIRRYITEYGHTPAVDGTGLPLCALLRTYTDPDPVGDHLMRVYEFYAGLASEHSLYDAVYDTY